MLLRPTELQYPAPTPSTQTAGEPSNRVKITQRFLSAPAQINTLFLLSRHRMAATDCRADRAGAFEAWHDICGTKLAA